MPTVKMRYSPMTYPYPFRPPALTEQRGSGTILVADRGVDDLEFLTASLPEDWQIRTVEGGENPLVVLREVFAAGCTSVHILAHGQPGAVRIGGHLLRLADIAAALRTAAVNCSMHFWSCRTGSGAEGRLFVQGLSQLVHGAVTAFSGLVGSGAHGGSWQPDVAAGLLLQPVAVPFASAAAYPHTLDDPDAVARYEIAFVDASLPDLETLIAGIPDTITVYRIDTGSSGLLQMNGILAGLSDVDAIHIFSHGSPGSLQIGTDMLSSATLDLYAEQLTTLAHSLTADGDILLYGCDIGQDSDFVLRFSQITGADVAASDDATGSEAAGGDWVLEETAVGVESAALSIPEYGGLLYNSVTVTRDTGAGEVTWIENTDEAYIARVSITIGYILYSNGFDGAMKYAVTGTGVTTSSEIYYSTSYGVAVQEVVVTASAATTYAITASGNLGSDTSTYWHYKDTDGPYYSISSDKASVSENYSDGDPVISLLFGDSALSSVGTSRTLSLPSASYDQYSFKVDGVSITAGTTHRYLFLAGVGGINNENDNTNTPDTAYAAVQNLLTPSAWPADFTSGLSSTALSEVVNWNIPTGNAAPVLADAGGTLSFTEGAVAAPIDSSLTLSDGDDTNIESATVQISSGYVSTEDVLSFTAQNDISGSWNASTGILTLSGSATKAYYEAALEAVKYQNTNTFNPNTSNRTISWIVNDGSASSTAVTSTITVTGTNDAAVITGTATATLTETNAVLSAGGTLAVSDIDGTAAFVAQSAATGTYGTFSITTAGVWSYQTPSAHNEFVAGQNYTDTFTVAADDGTEASVTLTLTGTNDAPTLTTIATLTGFTEDTFGEITYAALAAAANEGDVDGGSLSFRIEAVSSGTLEEWTGSAWQAVSAGSTLLSEGETLHWKGAADVNGSAVEAFRVVAWDGTATSGSAVQVKADVAAVNDVFVGRLVDGTVLYSSVSYSTISAALAAASDGDVILASSGIYNENITISKSVTLLGANHGSTAVVLDTDGNPVPDLTDLVRSHSESWINGTVTVASNDVTIDGFRLHDIDGPLKFAGSVLSDDDPATGLDNLTLVNNYITGYLAGNAPTLGTQGASVTNATGWTVEGNFIGGVITDATHYGSGSLYISGLADSSISDNAFWRPAAAHLYLSTLTNVTLDGNEFYHGLHAAGADFDGYADEFYGSVAYGYGDTGYGGTAYGGYSTGYGTAYGYGDTGYGYGDTYGETYFGRNYWFELKGVNDGVYITGNEGSYNSGGIQLYGEESGYSFDDIVISGNTFSDFVNADPYGTLTDEQSRHLSGLMGAINISVNEGASASDILIEDNIVTIGADQVYSAFDVSGLVQITGLVTNLVVLDNQLNWVPTESIEYNGITVPATSYFIVEDGDGLKVLEGIGLYAGIDGRVAIAGNAVTFTTASTLAIGAGIYIDNGLSETSYGLYSAETLITGDNVSVGPAVNSPDIVLDSFGGVLPDDFRVNYQIGTTPLYVLLQGETGAYSWVPVTNSTGLLVSPYAWQANEEPFVLNETEPQYASAGSAYAFQMPQGAFVDIYPDGSVLTYTATESDGTSLPDWLSFTASTRTFTGTPSETGAYSVKVSARDASNKTATDSFDVLVHSPSLYDVTLSTVYWHAGEEIEGVAFTASQSGTVVDTAVSSANGNAVLSTATSGTLSVAPTLALSRTGSDALQNGSAAEIAAEKAVNTNDAIAILKAAVGLISLNSYQQKAADVDADTHIGVLDAIAILEHEVGLPSFTPAWTFMDEGTASPVGTSLAVALTGDTVSGDETVELVGVLVGDVDGSWISP